MYTLAIYFYILCVRLAARFPIKHNKKALQLTRGHHNTWRILRRQVERNQSYIWVHASSLGEFEQGRPLIERLKQEHPQQRILLTFFSPSGYEVRKDYATADVVCYLPFDTPRNVRRFFSLVDISLAFFIKYEFWKHYLHALHQRRIPTYSVSSIFRPTQLFFRWYGLPYVKMLRCFTHFFVQNEQSQQLLATLGFANSTLVGDTRFDRVIDICKAAKEIPVVNCFCGASSGEHTILVAGSTWPEDEDLLLPYFNAHQEVKLILAPHVINEDHLHRIERKLRRPSVRFTLGSVETLQRAHCLIIDCYGLLSSIYRYGDIAYVGGGFGAGIHNVPEAAVFGVPVVIGPNNGKFKEAQDLLRLGGSVAVSGADDFASTVDQMLSDARIIRDRGERASTYIQSHAGATSKILSFLGLSDSERG